LNVIVGTGRNWRIPFFMPILLRYISGPVLAIIFSFAFPEFHTLRYDPMMITGFILSLIGISIMLVGFIAPRYYDVFVPAHRQNEGMEPTIANEDKEDVASVMSEPEKEKTGEMGDARVAIKRSEVEG
jgi:solute carrier family 6 GABA transporter-like protein 1